MIGSNVPKQKTIPKMPDGVKDPLPEGCDGFISRVMLPNGKTYALRCEVVAVHPMTCPKCGSPLELHYGEGKCEYCGTSYTSHFSIEEVKE